MKTFSVEITGKTPLLMHADNIDWADKMEAWKNKPENKKKSKPGDDRTPPFRWIGCLNHDNEVVVIPSEYIMRCLMEGGAQVLVPGGKSGKTFKAQTQSGLMCASLYWPLLVNGVTLSIQDIMALADPEFTFADQVETVEKMGFELFVKRARIGQQKHIRVRPRFNQWSAKGEVQVIDSQINHDVLAQIFTVCGQYKGLGDWRPGSKTPGSWGMFEARIS